MITFAKVPLLAAAVVGLAGPGAIALSSQASHPTFAAEPTIVPLPNHASGHLVAFNSDTQLKRFFAVRKKKLQQRESVQNIAVADVAMQAPAAAPPGIMANEPAGSAKSMSITNNQEVGVDEGGIVKMRGDTLVVLRRGRVFTISTAGGKLRPIDWIDAMPPGVDGSGDWYDEMLLYGDRVIVVGYSYARGGTEINRFRISEDGHLKFEDTYHLRSNDYYSSRNYASRLIGNRLVYYTPLYLEWGDDPFQGMPAVRRWTGKASARFTPIVKARDVFVPKNLRDDPDIPIDTAHSVLNCDLAAPVLACDAKVVIGPASRNFYVSGNAVYLWISDAWNWTAKARNGVRSYVYRMPFGPEGPSAIAARGAPTDQFSFREDPQSGLLDVLVRSEGGGDWMWNPEVAEGDVALLSIPIRYFGDGSKEVPLNRYRPLPRPSEPSWNFQNRFVGNYVLYGGGELGKADSATLVAAALRGGPVAEIALPHAVERLDVLGRDGVVIGADRKGGLQFTAIDLRKQLATRGDTYRMPAASQGESRSQAFFYRPDNDDGSNGILGLPIARQVDSSFDKFFGSAASILFLRRDARQFDLAGELGSHYRTAADDRCIASCVDWYGNARPIFVGNRIFGLLGYELVEGRLDRRGIREVSRVNFAPSGRRLAQRS